MKKVRCVAGAVGLVPFALAVGAAGATGTAQAAVTATGATTGKTVQMIPLSTGCAGNTYWSAKLYSASGGVLHKLWFWTRDDAPRVCVGTVEDSTTVYGDATNHQFRLRIYASQGTGFIREWNKVYPAALENGYLLATVGVHSSWPGTRVEVCGAWVQNNKSTSVTLAPACRIVTY